MQSNSPASSAPPLSLSGLALRLGHQPISALLAAGVHSPHLISFAAGLVDGETLPADECARIAQRILSDPQRGRAALQYDTTLGVKALRHAVLAHLEDLEGKPASEMGLDAEQVLITSGSQQALYLVGEALLDPGDIVITANPSYFVFAGTLQARGARVLAAPMDEGGMKVEAVAELLAKLDRQGELRRVKFIYCTSYYQNPTGLTLAAERRPKLLQLARQYSRDHRILILEDAAYRELRYDGPETPSIKSFDAENRYTILTQTFSKPFAPGLKTGYTFMPPDLLEAVVHQKGNHDFGSANLAQQIAAESMADGSYTEHLERLRAAYRTKRDLMLAALQRHLGDVGAVSWTHPRGGLYVWLTLPLNLDCSSQTPLFQACLQQGVLYVPGAFCFAADENGWIPKHHMRLSFGQVSADRIEPGIARLAAVLRRFAADPMQPHVNPP